MRASLFIPLLPLISAFAAGPTPVEKLFHQRVTMRDGVKLDTHVFHPAGSGRFPAILLRTPYGKGADLAPSYQSFLNHGYAVVVQDVRGRGESDGTFDALDQEGPDGFDTLNWIARQSWSSGRIGMIGGSYTGIAQWKVALLNNPHLKAIFPLVSGFDDYRDRFYSTGGGMKFGHRMLWFSENLLAPGAPHKTLAEFMYHLPLRTADRSATGQQLEVYQKALDHPSDDAFWRGISTREHSDRIQTPVFSVGGWYDNYVESDLDAFATLTRRGTPARILIGPWAHNMSFKFPNVDFGKESNANIRRLQIDWFDRWLKAPVAEGRPFPVIEEEEAPLRIFVMGANVWRDENEWPLARTRITPFFLSSKGHANTYFGDGSLEPKAKKKSPQDHFVDDPNRPVPTLGGAVCCNPKLFPWGPIDQRPVEKRNDVLIYTSTPLVRDLEVTGPIKVLLYASSSAPDTDFMAKLVDVFPSGEARNLTDGMLRIRYRNGLDRPVLGRPGEVYPLTIDAGVTSNVFLAGHRIRVEIASTNFPHFDRNPNTGKPVADATVLRKAQQTIYHDARNQSCLLLPVIPERESH